MSEFNLLKKIGPCNEKFPYISTAIWDIESVGTTSIIAINPICT